MKNLNALLVFLRVAESQSFKLAGDRLDLTPSAVSKSIKLKNQIHLVSTTLHPQSPHFTNDGQFFYTRCLNIFRK
jgi:DNA-binding transcriptional LysR family regulator